MRISTGQMAKIIMQTLQGAKDVGGQLELKVGTVVKATLLEFLDSKSNALLQIGNAKVRAQVDANLQPGDQLELLVTGEQKRGAMELKLIGQPVRGETGRAMPLDLAGILQALQLPDGEEMKALVQEFVGRNLPLTPEALKGAAQVLRAQGSTATPAQVATLGKMVELGIPLTPATFQALNTLDNGPKLHQLLESVAAKLQDLLPELADGGKSGASASAAQQTTARVGIPLTGTPSDAAGAGSPAQSASPASQSTLNQSTQQNVLRASGQAVPTSADTSPTARTLAGNALPATSSSAQTPDVPSARASQPDGLSAPARSESLFPRNEIPRPLPTTQAGNAVEAQPSLPEQAREPLRQLAKAVHELVSQGDGSADALRDKAKQLGLALEERLGAALRRLPADSDPATVRDAVQHALRNFAAETQGAGLKEALLNVQNSASELTAAGHAALADDVSTLLNNLTGQQLMSTPGQTAQRSDLFYQFAAVPLQLNGREQTVELHVMSRKGPGQKSLDPANCYILFRLDMPNLGPLDIHLHIVDRVVGVRFVAEDKDAVQIEAADQRELRDKLQGVGFHLGVMKSEEKQPPQEGQRLPLLPPLLTQGHFDLRM
ncbi:flagellar hook-length control protein FliK [Tumebacillus permanentifrigoris]|uniref:Flagellar hook-length control protein FliK n=1 Tax=Tumebacillus permanentifrigoris TaxID=378543 RepID=A0A316D7U6_9BACL|nr:flagellar hook-length control protein FliK [Tumebacillus permanentifrigoris]PWK12746.1 flagellar hook-length control protein FliK [Tumebacillus permanentifrigoris]